MGGEVTMVLCGPVQFYHNLKEFTIARASTIATAGEQLLELQPT